MPALAGRRCIVRLPVPCPVCFLAPPSICACACTGVSLWVCLALALAVLRPRASPNGLEVTYLAGLLGHVAERDLQFKTLRAAAEAGFNGVADRLHRMAVEHGLNRVIVVEVRSAVAPCVLQRVSHRAPYAATCCCK